MKTVNLTRGKVTFIDDEDYELISKYRWYAILARGHWYASAHIESWSSLNGMHRLIMSPKDNEVIDHVNGNGLDNQRSNLRICSHRQNIVNSKKRSGTSSEFKGVTWHCGKWQASIQTNRKSFYLGRYSDENEAAMAYDVKAVELFGNFAATNLKLKLF